MKRYLPLALLACSLAVTALMTGCCMCCGWANKEHYERSEQFSAPMAGVDQFKVDTSFGEVKITGADTADCSVTARITAQAPTVEEAKQLAEQTKITLETQGKTLVVKADKPYLKHNRSIGIAYNIIVPTKTAINCKTSFGEVDLKNITADVVAETSFGKIDADNLTGKIRLDTSYGEVDCAQITTGDFYAKSSFGKMKIDFSDACPADLKAKIETSYGEVETKLPRSFAGQANVETSFGSVKTELPITVKGEVGKTHLRGTIGEGSGNLDLKTSFGSVTIK